MQYKLEIIAGLLSGYAMDMTKGNVKSKNEKYYSILQNENTSLPFIEKFLIDKNVNAKLIYFWKRLEFGAYLLEFQKDQKIKIICLGDGSQEKCDKKISKLMNDYRCAYQIIWQPIPEDFQPVIFTEYLFRFLAGKIKLAEFDIDKILNQHQKRYFSRIMTNIAFWGSEASVFNKLTLVWKYHRINKLQEQWRFSNASDEKLLEYKKLNNELKCQIYTASLPALSLLCDQLPQDILEGAFISGTKKNFLRLLESVRIRLYNSMSNWEDTLANSISHDGAIKRRVNQELWINFIFASQLFSLIAQWIVHCAYRAQSYLKGEPNSSVFSVPSKRKAQLAGIAIGLTVNPKHFLKFTAINLFGRFSHRILTNPIIDDKKATALPRQNYLVDEKYFLYLSCFFIGFFEAVFTGSFDTMLILVSVIITNLMLEIFAKQRVREQNYFNDELDQAIIFLIFSICVFELSHFATGILFQGIKKFFIRAKFENIFCQSLSDGNDFCQVLPSSSSRWSFWSQATDQVSVTWQSATKLYTTLCDINPLTNTFYAVDCDPPMLIDVPRLA